MKAKHKKIKFQIPTYVNIISPYRLSTSEIDHIKSSIPLINNQEIKNSVDESLFAGIIVQIGTKRIDLSLSGGLKNLKNFIYESSQ